MQSSPSAPDRVSAFTLLELLVVVVLIGVLAAMAIPTMRDMAQSSKDREEAWRFAEFVEHSCRVAMMRSEEVCVEYESAAPSFRLGLPGGDPCATAAAMVFFETHQFPEISGVSVQHQRPGITDTIALVPGAFAWSCDALGRPAGVDGGLGDHTTHFGLGAPPGNENPRPRVEIQANYATGTVADLVLYPAGVMTADIQ